ncbi:MFS transporter [Synoicihabitans lomoniglobus]|uniref:MFS transporter n=1 Tax=Synoicihabitans lomoniglobus TaxID=2909285 RepID=A0AAF0CHA1_9BACT|nr:MFS transporter [Opitutaceae bacterium LMO-M01]WED64052.1 MFS transporter [Opitutaceae bacterium LMO-M01]
MTATSSEAKSRSVITPRGKIAYGSGVFLDQIGLHAVGSLANPIFNVALGVSPAALGIVMSVFRIWDAFTDPVVGNFSDNFRHPWGRRRPLIILGALLSGVFFAAIWWVPGGWSTSGILWYFAVLNLFYFTAHTIFSIPYQALAMELTPHYHERTRLMAVRSFISVIGWFGLSWVYPFAQLDIFGGVLTGIKVAGIAGGIIFIFSGVVPALFLKERLQTSAQQQEKITLTRAVSLTLSNRSFLALELVALLQVFGSNIVQTLLFYITTYCYFVGDPKAAAPYMGWYGTVGTLGMIVFIPLVPVISRRFDKKGALFIVLAICVIASVAEWFLLQIGNPLLTLITRFFYNGANIAFWTLWPSMVADLCDEDQLRTGRRREGSFMAVGQWINKAGLTLAIVVSGFLLVWIGFDAELEGRQSGGTLRWMQFCFSLLPAILGGISLLVLGGYRLTEKRMQEIQEALAEH